jgi:hypothetical protein
MSVVVGVKIEGSSSDVPKTSVDSESVDRVSGSEVPELSRDVSGKSVTLAEMSNTEDV